PKNGIFMPSLIERSGCSASLPASFCEPGASLPWFSAWGDSSTPRRLSGQVQVEPSYCGKLLVGDSLSGYRIHETGEPFQRVARHVALVQAEGELVNVSAKVLRGDMVI